MKTLKKFGKITFILSIFLIGSLLTITIFGTTVILLSKMLTNMLELNQYEQVLIASLLSAAMIIMLYKPYKRLIGKLDQLIGWAMN